MGEKYLVANTCVDRCGIRRTKQVVDGLPVYECPGCLSQWTDTKDAHQPTAYELAKKRVGQLLRTRR